MMIMFDATPSNLAPCALQQHPDFAAALRACGKTPLMLNGPDRLLVMQRRFRGGLRVALMSRAALTEPQLLRDRIREAGLRRHLILLSPDHPTPQLARIGAVPVMTPASVAEIDLSVARDERRAALHQKWRNRLRHAEQQGLRVTRQNMPLKPDHWLLRADAAQQSRLGYRSWPAALTLAFARENPGAAKLFTAFEGRDPVAAMLFLRHGAGATYHMGHITARGRAVSAHNLLLWQAAGWLAAKGHRRLDLGLIDTQRAAGLARFKLGAGASARVLGGTWAWWPPLGKTLRPLAALDRMGRTGNWTEPP